MDFIKEIWAFLRARKKLWLFPLIAAMVVLGLLMIVSQGSIIAPFVYTLF